MTIFATRLFTLALALHSIAAYPSDHMKIDAAIDLIFVPIAPCLDVNARSYAGLADFFKFGPKKTRVGVIQWISCNMSDDSVLLHLTDDPEIFESAVSNYTHQYAARGFVTSEEELLDFILGKDTAEDRLTVVVFIHAVALHSSADLPYAASIGDQLRDSSALVYTVATNFTTSQNYIAPKQWAEALCGNTQRIVLVDEDNFEKNLDAAMVKVKNLILQDLCQWESNCRFFDPAQRHCAFQSWPYPMAYLHNHGRCVDVRPNVWDPGCVDQMCRDTCDSLWPWNDLHSPDCSQHCGQTSVRRGTRTPPRESMKYCPYTFSCPPCQVRSKDGESGGKILEVKINDEGEEAQNPVFEIDYEVLPIKN